MDREIAGTLLCRCLGTECDGKLPDMLGALTKADWHSLVQEAGRHGVTPLLYHCLKTSRLAPYVPTDVMQRLRNVYLHSTAVNVRRFHDLGVILSALKEESIPVIVLKGAHLAEVVYGGSIGLRPMCDADLLLKREDLDRGYETLSKLSCFGAGKNSFNLDIHWNIEDVDLFGPRGLDMAQIHIGIEGLWERAQPAVIGGVEARVLCPEDLLIHLCTHLCFHHLLESAGLRGICDVRQTVRHYGGELRWEEVRRRSERWGVGNAVLLTLLLARELLNADVPSQVIDSIEPDDLDAGVVEWAYSQLFDARCDEGKSLSLYFWHMLSPDSFRDRVRHLLRLIVPPRLEGVSRQFPARHRAPRSLRRRFARLKERSWPYITALWRVLAREDEMAKAVKQQKRNIAVRKWLLQVPSHASQ